MKKRNCRGAALLLALLFLCVQPVKAEELDTDRTGSIRIELRTMEEPSKREGVELQIWKVGEVDPYGKPIFDPTYLQKDYPQDSASLDAAAKELAGKMTGEPKLQKKTDAAGVAEFGKVSAGIYLVCADKDNPYGIVSPFLIHLPWWEEAEQKFVYEVKAEPKASPEEPDEPEKPDKPDKPDDDDSDEPGTPSQPPEQIRSAQTGDDTPIGYYTGLLTASLAAIGGSGIWLWMRRKRERQETEHENK